MKRFLLLSAVALSSVSIAAFAQDNPPPSANAPQANQQGGAEGGMPPMGPGHNPMEKHMEEADTNHDGMISHEEFIAQAEKHFKEIDSNSDGKITKEERQKFHETHHQKMMEKHEERQKRREKIKDKMKQKAEEKQGQATPQ